MLLRVALAFVVCSRGHEQCSETQTDASPKVATSLASMAVDGTAQYNPEWKPGGHEGGIDTNTLPWLPFPQFPGCSMKPLRAIRETGSFAMLVKTPKGASWPTTYHFGSMDIFIISGKLQFAEYLVPATLHEGVWGYTPANTLVKGPTALEDTEALLTSYGAFATVQDGKFSNIFTSEDLRGMATKAKIPLLPTTLSECMGGHKEAYAGPADQLDFVKRGDPLSIPGIESLAGKALTNPHFVDTNALPWIVDPDAPDIGLKIMRVSTETGTVSMLVRQNGQAPPHLHLGPADFFITSGRIGYRAGPKNGFGPGTYMYEPAGARHEATQRLDKNVDLIYTANVYGPIMFDSGVGTPPLMVLSWMQYLASAEAFKSPLLRSTFPNDAGTLLASSMLR